MLEGFWQEIQTIGEASPRMQDSKTSSRQKAQLTKFATQLNEGLSKPLARFVGEMLFGVQASQGVKLRSTARSSEEDIPLIKTENCLSRNLTAKKLEAPRGARLASLGSRRVEANTVLCLDLSDVRKEYAEKMEYLDEIWDGSDGEVHQAYWLLSVTTAEVRGSEITTLSQKLFSGQAKDFVSEHAVILVPSAKCARILAIAASGPSTGEGIEKSCWSRCWSGGNAL